MQHYNQEDHALINEHLKCQSQSNPMVFTEEEIIFPLSSYNPLIFYAASVTDHISYKYTYNDTCVGP
jgi:hypothetical protein